MKVAFTSSDARTVDRHFGQAAEYRIWEIGPEAAGEIGSVRPLLAPELDEEGRTAARANAVAGCAIVCTVQVGGPAAAKLVARRIHPMKTGVEVPIAEVVARLQEVLRGDPPPWLRKAMGGGEASLGPDAADEE
jgi:nitrogen fixation protein NifX